ncbi:MAG: hypothetical protein GXY79_09335 [Chloroflexi bacterium]|nr:hypothetical protein [Chloroflexota bacterium]
MRRRKLLSTLIVLAALSAMLMAPLAASAAECTPSMAVKYVNAYNGLRMRTAPGLASPLITFLWNGEYVTVIGCDQWKDGILWSYVEVNRWGVKTAGWVSAAFLVSYVGYTEPRDSFEGDTGCKVIDGPLNLRDAAGLSGKILRTVPYGTILVPTSTPDVTVDGYVWQELQMNGTIVYGARKYMECFAAAQS